MVALFVGVIYLLILVGSWDAKDRKEEWGPVFLTRVLGWCIGTWLNLFGVASEIVFDDPEMAESLGGGAEDEDYDEEEHGLRFIGAASPHGAIPVGQIGFTMFAFRNDERLARFRTRIAGASVLFYVPVVRELLLLLGVRDASRETVRDLASDDVSIAISPGGIWEMVNTSHDEEKVRERETYF